MFKTFLKLNRWAFGSVVCFLLLCVASMWSFQNTSRTTILSVRYVAACLRNQIWLPWFFSLELPKNPFLCSPNYSLYSLTINLFLKILPENFQSFSLSFSRYLWAYASFWDTLKYLFWTLNILFEFLMFQNISGNFPKILELRSKAFFATCMQYASFEISGIILIAKLDNPNPDSTRPKTH